jgi:hypothetical protein
MGQREILRDARIIEAVFRKPDYVDGFHAYL